MPELHRDNPDKMIIDRLEKVIHEEQTPNDPYFEGKGLHSVRFYKRTPYRGPARMSVVGRPVFGPRSCKNEVEGGIYIASNVAKSYRVWKSQVQEDVTKNDYEILRIIRNLSKFVQTIMKYTVEKGHKGKG